MNHIFVLLVTTAAGGAALIVLALVIRKKQPGWVATYTIVAGIGGTAALPVIARLMHLIVGWGQDLLTWTAGKAAAVPAAGGPLGEAVRWLGAALPYMVAVLLIGWLVLDLFPRLGALRRRGGGGPGGGGGAATFGDRLAALHGARPHTMLIAILAPAAITFFPPFVSLMQGGVAA